MKRRIQRAFFHLEELRESTRILGFSRVYLLGYHDSGMPGTETNARPDNFANAPFDEAVAKLVEIIRGEQPQVVIGYAEDREFYPHPDHMPDLTDTLVALEDRLTSATLRGILDDNARALYAL